MTNQAIAIRKGEKLPTREQINQISDIQALEDMRDDVERRMFQIESDLDFRDGTEEWEGRALGALSIHRYTAKVISRRIDALSKPKPIAIDVAKKAERENCLPLTWMAIDGEFDDDNQTEILEEIDERLTTLQDAIESIEIDKADELSKKESARDLKWIAQANAALRRVRTSRHQLSIKKAAIIREEKERVRVSGERTRERLFISACREILPRETYLMLWDRADRLSVEGLEEAAAS